MEGSAVLIILASVFSHNILYGEGNDADVPAEGVHIALGPDPYVERTVMFVSKASLTTVDLMNPYPGHSNTKLTTYPARSLPLNLTIKKDTQETKLWIQKANLTNLDADQQYLYRVGKGIHAQKYQFKTWRMRSKQETYLPAMLLFFGNIKEEDGKVPAYRHLQEDINSHFYNGIFNLGSLACGVNFTQFLTNLQGLAGQVPFLTTPGEYEHHNKYQLYSQLFSMPNTNWPMDKFWYSFNTEKAHIVSINTQLYGLEADGMRTLQIKWLKADLDAANNVSLRNLNHTPWIIVFTHRPFYCSGDANCTEYRHKLRELEDMFYHFGVDLVITAQDNFYERTWPVYQDIHHQEHYLDPVYPVYISTSAFTCPGNKEKPSSNANFEWTARRINCRGMSTYAHLKIKNSTYIAWEEINASNNSVIDTFAIEQHHHGPFVVKVGHSSAVIAIVITCVVIMVVGATTILFWSRCRHFIQKRRAAKKMRYVNLNEGQLEL